MKTSLGTGPGSLGVVHPTSLRNNLNGRSPCFHGHPFAETVTTSHYRRIPFRATVEACPVLIDSFFEYGPQQGRKRRFLP
jgi:hypothetical protein